MKYYSEKLKKLFDDTESLEKAEKEQEEKYALELKKKEERATRAKEVDDAYKNYLKLLRAFVKDYGSYHFSYTNEDDGFIKFIDNLWHWPL